MPKFFVISDVHGFYNEMIEGLNNAGFDKNNPNHYLIGCGDYFDRGEKPAQVMEYLQSLPRKILVRGNHEDMLEDCLNRGRFSQTDWRNGIAGTVLDFDTSPTSDIETVWINAKNKIQPFLNGLVNYFETENYIFCHSFIPFDSHMIDMSKKTWRYSFDGEWEESRWENPFQLAKRYWAMLSTKTLVFGHWHTSYAWSETENYPEFGKGAKFDIYYGDDYIGIDACTVYSGKCNVLVVEDDFMI